MVLSVVLNEDVLENSHFRQMPKSAGCRSYRSPTLIWRASLAYIIGEIVDNLQDDSAALKAGAQTCSSLLLLCHKHIFRTITLGPRCQSNRSFASDPLFSA